MAKLSIDQALLKAKSHAKKGEIAEAKKIYSAILNSYPKNIKAKEGLDHLRKSRRSAAMQGAAQTKINQIFNLYNKGQMAAVIEKANILTRQYPKVLEVWNILGAAAAQTGQLAQAIHAFRKIIAIKPDDVQALNNMGIALQRQGKTEEAVKAYKKAINIKPDYAQAYNNMGNVLAEQSKTEEAVKAYKKATHIKPDYAEAYNNMGNILAEQGNLEEAVKAYKKAIHIKPDYVEAYNNMGNVLKSQRKVAEAIEAFKNALELKSDYADALHNMGQTFLAIKNFCEGFKLSAWRWKTKKLSGRFLTSAKPVWGGETNQQLLVWGEQGIGDEIMFASMIPELCEAQSKIIVQCDKRLIPLFQRSFCDKISFYSNDKRVCEDDYDYHIPMGSLPLFFRKSLGDFKIASHGFLRCDKKLAQNIRNQILLGRNKKLVGISWNTVSTSAHAKARNFSLRDLVLALDNGRTQLVSLQYGDVSAEIEAVKKDLDIEIVQYSSVDNMRDIDGLASIIMACDQVVTIDNCTVHLAGALGVKTDLLLPRTCDWRWGLDCDDSYWYESVKLHRQSKNANWNMRISQFTAQ